jgi:hypothetical protein
VGVDADDSGQVVVSGQSGRRSIYIQQKRSQPVSLMAAFDAPVMETHCERRTSATVATQSLMLMNGSFILDQAGKLATLASDQKTLPVLTSSDCISEAAKGSPAAPSEPSNLPGVVASIWERAYSRAPSVTELSSAIAFVRDHIKSNAPTAPGLKADQPAHRVLTALGHLGQTLMASNEFLYQD